MGNYLYSKESELTEDQLQKRRRFNSKFFKFGCLPIIVILFLSVLISNLFSSKSHAGPFKFNGLDTSDVFIYSIKNANGLLTIAVYCDNDSLIPIANKQVDAYYDKDGNTDIWINYFNNINVIPYYFKYELDPDKPENVKDSLFQFYRANFKNNPSSGYRKLFFEHE